MFCLRFGGRRVEFYSDYVTLVVGFERGGARLSRRLER